MLDLFNDPFSLIAQEYKGSMQLYMLNNLEAWSKNDILSNGELFQQAVYRKIIKDVINLPTRQKKPRKI